MTGTLSRVHMIFILLLCLTACTSREMARSKGAPVQVQISEIRPETGEYALSIVTLSTISNLSDLTGAAAEFHISPKLEGGRLVGSRPQIRAIQNSKGVLIFTDIVSLHLVSLYKIFEDLLKMDQALGLDGLLPWPRQVAYNAQFRMNGQVVTNNAFYAGEEDIYIFVPFTGEDLPLQVNAGVVGHEHFHAFFNKLFLQPVSVAEGKPVGFGNPHLHRLFSVQERDPVNDKEIESFDLNNEIYHEVLIRGLNEGLADVWGWIFSGDRNFVGRSIPSEKKTRTLDLPSNRFVSTAELKSWVAQSSEHEALALSYVFGNGLARSLKTLIAMEENVSADAVSREVKMKWAQKVISALPKLKEEYLKSVSQKRTLAPGKIIELVLFQSQKLKPETCAALGKFLPDLASETKVKACSKE